MDNFIKREISSAPFQRIQEKKKKLRDNFKAGLLRISEEKLQWQLAAIGTFESTPTPASGKHQPTIFEMFSKPTANKQPCAPSVDDDIQLIPGPSGGSSKRPRTGRADPSPAASIALRMEEEESSSSDESDIEDELEVEPEALEEQARQADGDAAIDSIAEADHIAEWVDVLDDAAPRGPDKLESLATDCGMGGCAR
jgi:hypothetical protein